MLGRCCYTLARKIVFYHRLLFVNTLFKEMNVNRWYFPQPFFWSWWNVTRSTARPLAWICQKYSWRWKLQSKSLFFSHFMTTFYGNKKPLSLNGASGGCWLVSGRKWLDRSDHLTQGRCYSPVCDQHAKRLWETSGECNSQRSAVTTQRETGSCHCKWFHHVYTSTVLTERKQLLFSNHVLTLVVVSQPGLTWYCAHAHKRY